MKRNVYTIFDGQLGDAGKGKAISEFALEKNPAMAMVNHGPNADHTCVINGVKRVFRSVPVSCVNKNTDLFLGSSVSIDMALLEKEYHENVDLLDGREIIAHPNIKLIEQRHKDYENEGLKKSGTTSSGSGACESERVMRQADLKPFKGYKDIRVVGIDEWLNRLKDYNDSNRAILLEGSQGCALDRDYSGYYPNTTYRKIGVAQMLADAGISPNWLKESIMIIRPYPIRIAVGDNGESGELSWEQINLAASTGGYPIVGEDIDGMDGDITCDYTEMSSHNEPIKRVFAINIKQIKQAIQINEPNWLYLNFFQQLDNAYENIRGKSSEIYFSKYLRRYLEWLEEELEVPIKRLGTGAENGAYIKVLKRK